MLPTLVITKSDGSLVVPTGCGAKSPEAGSTWITGAPVACPVPESAIVCGLPLALLVMVRLPVRGPAVSGVNVTSIVHVAPGATDTPHADENEKSPLTLIDVMVRLPGPLLVMVTVCGGLVVETGRVANVSDDGVNVMIGTGAVGVTAFEGADAGPVPTALVATTVKVYVVPLANPVTVIGEPAPEAVMPPGLELTV